MNEFLNTLSDWITSVLDTVLTGGGDVLSQITDALGDFIADNGIPAAYGLLLLEESGLPMPVPGDVMVIYVGRQIALGEISWWLGWLLFIVIVTIGASVLFTISRLFGDRLTRRVGRFMHLTPANLKRAEQWFEKRGALAIIFGRHIPGLRVPITVAAGMFKVRYPVFAVSVAISTAIWSGVFLIVGALLGDKALRLLHPHRGSYVFVALGVAGVVVAIFILRRRQHHKLRATERETSP